MGKYGQFPGGGFGGDENCRPGYTDPRQGFETCGIVEFMHSFEMLTKISGDPLWADRCEEIAFNSLPAAMTPDLKALHYLTCANQVQLDRKNKAPEIENGGDMFAYSPFENFRCCQHNVSHGWPYYAEELWLATADRGLCASLYAASEVNARVGEGTKVKVTETTGYPFSGEVLIKLSLPQDSKFPLYLRVPRWCSAPSVKVNGKTLRVKAAPLSYIAIDRVWKDADEVALDLPMKANLRTWAENKNAVSIDYGPLTYSLKIGERWATFGDRGEWKQSEVFPTSPWNYGLVLEGRNPAKSFKVIRTSASVPDQPFTPGTVPITLQAKARKIPAWQQDWFGLVGKLQPSPVKSEEPVETITLIPMGAARLRVTAFPVIGKGKSAYEWTIPKPMPVSASHCFESDTLEALIDAKEPKSSNDSTIPRFTWWDHRGTSEWVQQDFGKARKVSAVEVYWFDDAGSGQCRPPASWRVLYQDGESWKAVANPSQAATELNTFNRVTFRPVRTTALRVEAKLQPEFSAGILELKIE